MKKIAERILMAVAVFVTMTGTAFADELSPYSVTVPESSPEFVWTNRLILLGIAVVSLGTVFIVNKVNKRKAAKATIKAEKVNANMDAVRA